MGEAPHALWFQSIDIRILSLFISFKTIWTSHLKEYFKLKWDWQIFSFVYIMFLYYIHFRLFGTYNIYIYINSKEISKYWTNKYFCDSTQTFGPTDWKCTLLFYNFFFNWLFSDSNYWLMYIYFISLRMFCSGLFEKDVMVVRLIFFFFFLVWALYILRIEFIFFSTLIEYRCYSDECRLEIILMPGPLQMSWRCLLKVNIIYLDRCNQMTLQQPPRCSLQKMYQISSVCALLISCQPSSTFQNIWTAQLAALNSIWKVSYDELCM